MSADGVASPPLIRLVIFGDSWARCDGVHTWPELLGEQLGWATINVALPGSDSGTLELQLQLLAKVLERSGRQLHPDSWALVHTGGNDLLRTGPNGIIRAVVRTLCGCCACLPPCWGALGMLDDVAGNIGTLATRLREPPFGVSNLMLVGMPLCIAMPVVARYLDFLLGVSPLLRFAGRFAVRRLNTMHLARLRDVGRRLGDASKVVTLDEASAIESIAAAAAAQYALEGNGIEGEGNGTGGEEGEGEADTYGLWQDMMHPSQRCHYQLSRSFLATLESEHLRGVPSGSNCSDSDGSDGVQESSTARLI